MDKKRKRTAKKKNPGKPHDHKQSPPVPPRNTKQEDEESLEYEMVRRHQEKFDPKRWEQAMEQKRQMPRTIAGTLDPGPEVAKLLRGKIGVFIGFKNSQAIIRKAKNPQEKGSFGFVGTFAEVVSKDSYLDGTLVLRFDSKKLGTVARESLRIFCWDEKGKKFLKAADSNVSQEGDYAWARINVPGIYAVIGVNAHPLVLHTLKALNSVRGLMDSVPDEVAIAIKDQLIKSVLFAPSVQKALKQSSVFARLVREAEWYGYQLPPINDLPNPEDFAKSYQDLAAKIPASSLPEFHIIDELVRFPASICFNPVWESVGPFGISGAIRQILIDPADDNRLYAVADNGGIWVLDEISRYPGTSWRPLTDQLEDLRMHALAVAPKNNRILYIANELGYVYRSSDRGDHWIRTDDDSLGNIRKILVHPLNSGVVYVASDQGLWLSLASGFAGWSLIRNGDVLDAVLDPTDPGIMYLAEKNRNSNVVKIYKWSSPSGRWEEVFSSEQANSPADWNTRIALGYRNADGNLQRDNNRTVVVKFGDEVWINQRGGRDRGEDWVMKGKRPDTRQLWWNNTVAVDPFDPNVILAGGVSLDRTADGGNNWSTVADRAAPHEDHHSIEFDKNHRGLVYLCNDGGVFRSTDGGITWYKRVGDKIDPSMEIIARRNLNYGLVTAQFYRVGVQGNRAYGNIYHSGIIRAYSLPSDWLPAGLHGWEFVNVFSDPKRPGRFYLFRGVNKLWIHQPTPPVLRKFGDFNPYTQLQSVVGAIAVDTRPDSDVILVGVDRSPTDGIYKLMVTREGNQLPAPTNGSWTGLPTWTDEIDNSIEPFVSIMFSPSRPGRVYTITSMGRVFAKDEVKNSGPWSETGQWLTGSRRVRQLAVNYQHDNRLYAITDRTVARSESSGDSWTEIGSDTLPASEFNSIVAHPTEGHTLFLGADSGVYLSTDEGDTWTPYDDDLPNAEVLQIFFESGYLYAVTHGRGLWRRRPC